MDKTVWKSTKIVVDPIFFFLFCQFWLRGIRSSQHALPCRSVCLRKPVQLAGAHLQTWDVFSLLWSVQWSWATGARWGSSWAAAVKEKDSTWERRARKTLKHSKVPGEHTERPLSWSEPSLCPINTLPSETLRSLLQKKKKPTKASKNQDPHVL